MKLSEIAARGEDNYQVIIALMNGMGDAVLALPAIRHIVRLFGSQNVILWAGRMYCHTVFHEFSQFTTPTIGTHQPSAETKIQQLNAIRQRLRFNTRLIWINFNYYYPPTEAEHYVLSHLKPQHYYHFRSGLRRSALSAPLFHRRDQYFRVIGEEFMPRHLDRTPVVSQADRSQALAQLLPDQSNEKADIALHAQTDPEKQFPPSFWLALSSSFLDRARFWLLGKKIEQHPMYDILREHNTFRVVKGNWGEQVAFLAQADGFVGVDSSFAHVADALNVPGVVLFRSGINHLNEWGPTSGVLTALLVKELRDESKQVALMREILTEKILKIRD